MRGSGWFSHNRVSRNEALSANPKKEMREGQETEGTV